MLLLWLLSPAFCQCSLHLNSYFGFSTFSKEVPDGTTLCINISQFPYFFVPHSLPIDAVLDEYTSLDNSTSLFSEHAVIEYADILPFRSLHDPFSAHALTLPSGGNVSFVFGSPAGTCRDGIIFTNKPKTNLSLATAAASPFTLSVNDDKCVVFTAPGQQRFSLKMRTEECCDKLFLYENGMDRVRAFSGDIDALYFGVNATSHPSLFRVMTDAKNLTNDVSLLVDTDGAVPEDVFLAFWDPMEQVEDTSVCTFWMTVDWVVVGIVAGSLVGAILLFSLLFWLTALCCCNHFLRPGKETDSKDSGKKIVAEARNEPAGYFALDPILRPNY